MINTILDRWHKTFGSKAPDVIVRAPGRVNIIGEHTDYNEGWVLPGAMSRSIYILASRKATNGHHWIAFDLDEEIESLEDIFEYGEYPWAKYIEGAIRLYALDIGSLQLLVGGDLPVGAGISSSSALVCGVLYALQQLSGRNESKEELALTGQRVEREVIGVQGGIMDQFAIMMSQPRHVMLLDCRTRAHTLVDADLPGCTWILINTRVKHALIDSDYNQRAAQCKQAVAIIRQTYPDVQALRDVDMDMLKTSDLNETLWKRSAFVIEENDRVHEMVQALHEHDAERAGSLLKTSHEGLRRMYEVSCDELDHLADFANQYDGVRGARMMGGGFGGCVICLIKEEALETFSIACVDSYLDRFGFEPEVILFDLAAGVGLINT
ncbi:MAG: galactokinase [Saprospiraceae bacterium]|nr:galactokinase [Saprospiraceae bacterium]